jgi:hypothetical protein
MITFLALKTLTTRIVYNKGLDQGCTPFKSSFCPSFCLKILSSVGAKGLGLIGVDAIE